MEKKLKWTTAVYAFNWLVVCLCCGGTYMLLVHPVKTITYYLFEGQSLPPRCDMLMNNSWILGLIPLLWGAVTIAFAVTKHATRKIVFHVLASVLLWGLPLFIYATGLMLPILDMILNRSMGGK